MQRLISLSTARRIFGLPESADRATVEAAHAREVAAIKASRPAAVGRAAGRPASHVAAEAVVASTARSWSAEVAAINAATAPAGSGEAHESFMRRLNPAVAASSASSATLASWLTEAADKPAPPVMEPRSITERGYESVPPVIEGETHQEFMARSFGLGPDGVKVPRPRAGFLTARRPGAGSRDFSY